MSPATRPLDALAAAITVILCLSWGFNQVAVKLALPDIPPLIQATIRSVGALVLIAAWMRLRRVPIINCDGTLLPGLITGILFSLEFVLIYRGLLYTTASRGVVFLYTAPFFVALGARWLLPGERLRWMQWLGLALSFTGIAIAVGVQDSAADPHTIVGDLMLIGAGAMWASTTLLIKGSALAKTSAEKVLAYQLAVSIPILACCTLIFGERITEWPGAIPLAWLAYQTIWVVPLTYAAWFALVQRYSASRLSAFSFLTPLFGVAAGHFVAGDALTPVFAGAVILVVAGLILVNRPY